MTRGDPYAFATLAAEKMIREMDDTFLPIDPIAIARSRNIGDVNTSGRGVRDRIRHAH
jgi:hypothetical protein